MTARGAALVAITGGSGSGKTWLAEWLRRLVGPAAAVHVRQDDFYLDRSHLPAGRRHRLNFDHPRALDWEAFETCLRALAAGAEAPRPEYDFTRHARGAIAALRPRPLVVVDGLWLLRRPAVRRLFDLRVFLACPEDERLRRRLARDTTERGRTEDSVRRQFRTTVTPMHRRYVDPQARWADLVLNHPVGTADLLQLGGAVWDVLRPRAARWPAACHAWFRAGFRSVLEPPFTPRCA